MRTYFVISDYRGRFYDEEDNLCTKVPNIFSFKLQKSIPSHTQYADYQAAEVAMVEAVKHLPEGIGQIQKIYSNE